MQEPCQLYGRTAYLHDILTYLWLMGNFGTVTLPNISTSKSYRITIHAFFLKGVNDPIKISRRLISTTLKDTWSDDVDISGVSVIANKPQASNYCQNMPPLPWTLNATMSMTWSINWTAADLLQIQLWTLKETLNATIITTQLVLFLI